MSFDTMTATRTAPQLLSGVKVLDLAHVLAGPSCGWMLAMLGADVIKVERPHEGDLLRIVDNDPARKSARMSQGFQAVNAGKRSLAVDFKSEPGRKIVLSLVDRSDVLIQSFRAGALDDIGLGPDDLIQRNPRLIYCAISGFGQDGPRKGVRAFDHVIQAASGIMALTGEPDGAPQKVGTPVSDTSTGIMAAFAVLAALYDRERTGKGRFLDVSMLHTMFALMSPQVMQSLLSNAPPPRLGNGAFTQSPTANCFRCQDADILIGANTDEQFCKLMRALDRAELIQDPRFDGLDVRKKNQPTLAREIETALATQTAVEWERRLCAAGVPASVVSNLYQALRHPQFDEDPVVTWMTSTPQTGHVPLPNLPFKIDGVRNPPPVAPPMVGADTIEILSALGLPEGAVEDLIANGVASVPESSSEELPNG